jgi:Uma2 family endonuclease
MSVALLPAPKIPQLFPASPPQPRLWTVREFHELSEQGWFQNSRAMLIHGVIVEEGPMNPPHRIACELTEEVIRNVFGAGWRVCIEKPLVLSQAIDPKPDLAVVRGSVRGTTEHPTSAELVIEVSDTSFLYDTTEKKALYAAAGIPEYWVLDLNARRLLVFRDPQGSDYLTQLQYGEADRVSPLAMPTATVLVKDCLP